MEWPPLFQPLAGPIRVARRCGGHSSVDNWFFVKFQGLRIVAASPEKVYTDAIVGEVQLNNFVTINKLACQSV